MRRNGNENTDLSHKTRRKPGRVPTSCAECRRLKLRCDKNIPCEKCVSRGCGSICPDGTLAPGKGNRLVLANTEELHDRIEQLCIRIRELENALRMLQESVSPDPHPLLQTSPGVLRLTSQPLQLSLAATSPSLPDTPGPQTPQESHVESHPPSAEDESFVDAFGTLTLGRHGESTFFGQTARAEYLISAPSFSQSGTNAPPTRLSKQFAEPVLLGPDRAIEGVGDQLFRLLPPLPEAIHLCEVYRAYGKYMYASIPREELFDEILEPIYRAESFEAVRSYHVMAVLFGVFSLGALFDPDRQPYSSESQEYCYLARVTLGCNSQATRLSITGHVLVAQYLFYSDCEYTNSNSSWMYIGHAVRLGHSIGLHLDSSRWKLSQENVQRRRRLFWQLFVLDTWTSFCFGRPPIMTSAYIDCPLPQETEDIVTEDGKQFSFHSWIRQYTVLLHSVMSNAFGAKQPSYSVIISLDRKIRDFPIPAHWRPVSDDTEGPAPVVSVELNMQRWMCMSVKETTLLSLHRPYFTQALKDMPMDLARHRYIPSVIAIYRSAWRIIEGLQLTWQRIPQALARFSLAWSQALAASIVMCLLVTRAPTSNMTTSALAELDTVLKLFEDGTLHSPAVANFLDSIRNLHRKAHDSVDQTQSHSSTTITPSELDRLSGKTHLLADAGARDSGDSGPSDSITHTDSLAAQGYAFGIGPEFFRETNNKTMHPTIAQDLRSFEMDTAAFNNVFLDFPAAASPTPQHPMPNLRGSDIGFYSTPNYGTYQPLSTHTTAGLEHHQPAPVLDATWQSFVEQLGF